MKQKLIKYFEINKLDRGLFRIWLVLAIVWFLLMIILFIQEGVFERYQNESAKGWKCRLSVKTFQYEAYDKKGAVPFFGDNFDTLKKCNSFIHRARNDLIGIILFIITSPLFVLLSWLIIKKIFLWIYRGFK